MCPKYSRAKELLGVNMDVKQDANIEAEGQFGKPEFFARWLFKPLRQH